MITENVCVLSVILVCDLLCNWTDTNTLCQWHHCDDVPSECVGEVSDSGSGSGSGSSSESEEEKFFDGYDENLIGDEEDKKKLEQMTEKEREQELFNRMERRAVLKTRYWCLRPPVQICLWQLWCVFSLCFVVQGKHTEKYIWVKKSKKKIVFIIPQPKRAGYTVIPRNSLRPSIWGHVFVTYNLKTTTHILFKLCEHFWWL